jgi:hypothetical protein
VVSVRGVDESMNEIPDPPDDDSGQEVPADNEEDGQGGQSETADTRGDHLAGVEDGCGCAEVWEHLSERRRETDD